MAIQIPIIDRILASEIKFTDSLLIQIAQRTKQALKDLDANYGAEIQPIDLGQIEGKDVVLFPEQATFWGDPNRDQSAQIASVIWDDMFSRSSLDISGDKIEFVIFAKEDSSDSTKYELKLDEIEQELTSFRETIGQGI